MKHELIQSGKSYLHLQPLMDDILEVRYTDLERQLAGCEELLGISEAEQYQYGLIFSLTYLGDYYIARNNGEMAHKYLERAKNLCPPQKYTELQMNLNIFYGIYYDMMLDQFMSLSCTLEALELATSINDLFRKSVILNNIANMFETFGDLEAAKTYYDESLACLEAAEPATKNTTHYALLLANLVHLSCSSGKVEEAKEFLKKFDYIDLTTNDHLGQYLVSCCHLAAIRQDFATIRDHTDRVIALLADDARWGYQYYEILLHIAKFALDFQDREYTYKVLTNLEALASGGDVGNRLRVQKYWVRYYEMFGTEEEQSLAYKRHYQLKEIIDVTNNRTMSAGLHAKISLRQVKKKQEEMVKITEKLENEAQCDDLTQLFNRRSFSSIADSIMEDNTVQSLGLAMIDVDYFKQYNDTYGHASGDIVLRAVAECMTQAAVGKKHIYNFRYGGDEFVCMYKNCSEADMEHYVKTLVRLVRNRHLVHQQSGCGDVVTLSIGFHWVTRAPETPLDAVALLAQADKALYWSKGRGRNSHSRYTAEMASTLSRAL